jgi:soluble lytic murein transglycosylase
MAALKDLREHYASGTCESNDTWGVRYTMSKTLAAKFRRTSLTTTAIVAAAGLAAAQGPSAPYPYVASPPASSGGLSSSDASGVQAVLTAARSGDGARIQSIMGGLYDPTARKIALWALADSAPASMTFAQADAARRDLAGWPRPGRRQIAAETELDQSGLSPAQVVSWFAGADPQSARGALLLGNALRAMGQTQAAYTVVHKAWRTQVFDEPTQNLFLAGFGSILTPEDNAARVDLLLYGPPSAAIQDLLARLPPEQQALANARMAARRGDPNLSSLIAALPPALQKNPGLIYERVLWLRDHDQMELARSLMKDLPAELPSQAAAEKLWKHGALVTDALKTGDSAGAYVAASHSGLTTGTPAGEAAFYAGWIALTRLHDPHSADEYFARLQTIGQSPLTQSRAFYWRGRAADAMDDPVAAQIFYGQAAHFYTAFYGQLAAVKAGLPMLVLGEDPKISPADRASFEARDTVRALRFLYGIDARDAFRAFAADMAETFTSATDDALLVDLTRGYGDQELSMRVVRNAAKHGYILPERGYPVRAPPFVVGAPEAGFVLGITRQESSFDPRARSGAGARGMMQLMPATAQIVARQQGIAYSPADLDDPDFNMTLGAAYLGQLVNQFSGSYVMAAAAYNAGPGRPNTWSAYCGDPRSTSTDPVNFIECIPFSETRDYVMRVLEAAQVYRARLNHGSAPITLPNDLHRGSYAYKAGPAVTGPAAGPETLVGAGPPPPAQPETP